jgi:putative aldouronate transport system permease protein
MPADARRRRAPAAPDGAGRWHRLRRDRSLLLMTVPMVALLVLFTYIPLAGNVVAFLDYSPYAGLWESAWAGVRHFERMIADPAFWSATGNTLAITAFQLVFFFPIPIALALLLNSVLSPKTRTLVQTIVYLPHFFSWVLVVSIFQQLLGGAGVLNQILRDNGFTGVDLMTNPDTFLLLVTTQAVWKDAGWGMIVFLAAMAAVNTELYEASAMDGASRWRRMWHVTLPALRPVVILLLVLRLGDALTVGFEQMLLQRDAVGADAAEVLDTFVYYTGVQYGDWSYAAAAGLFKGVVGLVLVIAANKVAHAFGQEGVYTRR